jgi:hypothetical protein
MYVITCIITGKASVTHVTHVTVATWVATLHVTSGVSEMSHDLIQAPYRAITVYNQDL